MFHDLDDATVEHFEEENGMRRQKRRVLYRHAIRAFRGHWADAVFVFQDFNPSRGGWQPPRVRFAKYRWIGYRWRQQNAYNMSMHNARELLRLMSDFAVALERAQNEAPASKPG